MAAGDQERADAARDSIIRDRAVEIMEQELWDRGIAHVAEGTGTRDLDSILGEGAYDRAVRENRIEAEQAVDDRERE